MPCGELLFKKLIIRTHADFTLWDRIIWNKNERKVDKYTSSERMNE